MKISSIRSEKPFIPFTIKIDVESAKEADQLLNLLSAYCNSNDDDFSKEDSAIQSKIKNEINTNLKYPEHVPKL